MIEKLKAVPPQKALRVAAVAVALIAFILATLTRGLFDGITLTIGIAALALSLLQRLPSRPGLVVGPRAGDVLIARHEKPVRPIDADEIVAAEMAASEKEMPRMPMVEYPSGHPAAALFAAERHLAETSAGVTDASLRKFMKKVTEHTIKLRKWLDAVERAREDRLRVFEGGLRIREEGQAAADHVRLTLRLPPGFEIDEELPTVPYPPDRPLYESGFSGARLPRGLLNETYLQPNTRIRLPGTDAPNYSAEAGRVIVNWDLGRVNQSAQRDVPAFYLKAPEPGTYQAEWEITAGGLASPAKGTLTIKVETPEAAEPITTLEEVEAERKSRELAYTD